MTQSLLFARTLQDADDSALIDWNWYKTDELNSEYRRPDDNERVRFCPDKPECLRGLVWNTRVYLGRNWEKRDDAPKIRTLLSEGFFSPGDPELPPPRRKTKKADALSEIRRTLERLEKT